MKHIDIAQQLRIGHPGGDLWNDSTKARKAQELGAVALEYRHIGTGLWLDCTLIMADGSRQKARLYG